MNKCIGIIGLFFGHKFEARYETGASKGYDLEGHFSFRQMADLLEATKPKKYRGDVCVRCGMVVNNNE